MSDHANNPLHPNIGGRIFINPGSGAVTGATEDNAFNNMRAFIADCPISTELHFRRVPHKDYGDGRFAFQVIRAGHDQIAEVQMPGWTLKKVRYMGEEGQDPWDFPRLYLDDSSWLWNYALIDEEYYEFYEDEDES